MRRRIKIEDIQKLDKEYLQREKSSEFKAIIIKLIEKTRLGVKIRLA